MYFYSHDAGYHEKHMKNLEIVISTKTVFASVCL